MRHVRLISVLATTAVLAAWLLWDRRSPTHALPHESATPASRMTEPLTVAIRPRAPPAMPPPASSHRDQTEMCGLGWIDKNVDEARQAAVDRQWASLANQGRRGIAARMLADPDPFSRAVGSLVQRSADDEDRRRAAGGDPETCDGTACPLDEERAAAADAVADTLARQAVESRDPRLYVLALHTCRTDLPKKSAPACALLSPRQWMRIDPDNGAPWLETLRNTTDQDAATVDEALFQIAKAKRFDDNFFAAAGEIARHALPDDNSTLGAYAASVDAIGFSAAVSAPLDKLRGACRSKALTDSNRRQLCEGVADALVDRSNTLLTVTIGAAIGRELGWDPGRADAARGLQYALADAWRSDADPAGGGVSTSCSDERNSLQQLTREAAIGEPGSAREWLAANGKAMDPYTQRARTLRLRGEAEQQARAAGAAEPSPPSPDLAGR